MTVSSAQIAENKRLFTGHGTVLFVDIQSGELKHGSLESSPLNVLLMPDGERIKISLAGPHGPEDILFSAECSAVLGSKRLNDTAAAGVFTLVSTNNREFGLRDRDVFLSAESDGRITLSRSECRAWELFHTRLDAFELSGTVSSHRIDGQVIHFFITNRYDYIQSYQCRGDFYDRGALDVIRSNCKPERTFVDIGANIGNHAVFASKFCSVCEVIVFEPNPGAIDILKINLALNACTNVDARYLGLALGSETSRMRAFHPARSNLGGAQMLRESSGEINCIRGDDVLLQRPVGFIKIDVEGMEFDVLKGLQGTIELWRPNVLIEVWPQSRDALRLWCEQCGYTVIKDLVWDNNYLLGPK